MAKEVILVRYGEIALKGKNRINFENRLISNIKKVVSVDVKRTSGRFIAYPKDEKEIDCLIEKIRRVFGITSISIAKEAELEIEKIKEEVLKQTKNKKFSTFRITVQRLQKRLKTSPELEKEIGSFVVEKTGKKVKLKGPDLEIGIDISENAYVFTERIGCFGGLPKGVEGNVALFIDGKIGKDASVLAGLLMMKRGCNVYPFSYKEQDIPFLEKYGSEKLSVVKNMEELERFAVKKECRAIVIGQTLGDFEELKTGMVVLRPLICFDEEEVDNKIKEFES